MFYDVHTGTHRVQSDYGRGAIKGGGGEQSRVGFGHRFGLYVTLI
jgi:hypothetical protein